MLFKILFFGIIALIIFLVIKRKLSNYRFKFDFITVFEGQLGSGKTTMLAYHVIKALKRRRRRNLIFSIFNVFLISRFKIKLYSEEVFSDFPLYLGKRFGWSRVVDDKFMSWAYKLPNGCLIAIDELAFLFPAKGQVSSDLERFTSVWLRHALGCNSRIFGATQSMSEVAIYLRRRMGHVYHLSGCRPVGFRSCVNVIDVLMSEDIVNVYNESVKNFKENIFYFRYPKKAFKSDYGSCFYNLEMEKLKRISSLSDIFKLYNIRVLSYWKDYDYINNGV